MMLVWLLACAPAPEDIAKAIASENPQMREDGAKIAQNYDDEVVIAALVGVLTDPSEQVRLNAIESLAELDATSAGSPLIARLADDPSAKVRRAAVDALGRLAVQESIPVIITYMAGFSPDDRDQLAGIWALGTIGAEGLPAASKKQALDTLVTLRNTTSDKHIRYQASAALRTLK